MVRSRRLDKPTSYQDFVSFCRRFDRDSAIIALANISRGWDGNAYDEKGVPKAILPWNVAGSAATLIARGTAGGKSPEIVDVVKLTNLYANLEHPGDVGGDYFGSALIARFVYQQWPFVRHGLSDWARTVALLCDTPFPAGYLPEVMSEGWDTELLGTTVPSFVSIGFCLHATAELGGGYPLMWDETLSDVLSLLGGEVLFDKVVEQNFIADVGTFKRQRIDYVAGLAGTEFARYKQEPFAFNPLFGTPFIRGIAGSDAIAPCAPIIALKTSLIGVAYTGLERWGDAFTRDLGHLFERYVGRQLDFMNGAIVLPEIEYRVGRQQLKSIDWIVVRQEAVILIECKSTIPSRDVHEGTERIGQAHVVKLEKGIRQINRTAKAIRDRRPEFRAIPGDRPIIGFVTTLGNYDIANEPTIREMLPTADVPVGIAGVEFIEGLVTLHDADLRSLLERALERSQDSNIVEPRGLLEAETVYPNALLDDAFSAIPIIQRVLDGR